MAMKYKILVDSLALVNSSLNLYEVMVEVTDDQHRVSHKCFGIKSTPYGVLLNQEQLMKDFPDQGARNHIHLWIKQNAAKAISALNEQEE